MTRSQALVSIGMPVRNNASTIAECINSLRLQTHTDWELLLVDDGSGDESTEIARGFDDCRIKVCGDGRAMGIQARLNKAVREAKGDYFARMDADDIAYPERLERQLGYLQEHPRVSLVGTWVMVFGKGGEALGKRAGAESHEKITSTPYSGFPMAHPTFFGRIGYFRRHPYPVGAIRAEDQILLLQTFRRERFANVPEILLGYREESLSLPKILLGRYWFARNAARELRRRGKHVRAGEVMAEQIAKGIFDVLAVTSGLDYRLLRHRAQPVSQDEVQRWREVWSRACNPGNDQR
jgi:glycosyltransferase involved in cell wall biosynthesis